MFDRLEASFGVPFGAYNFVILQVSESCWEVHVRPHPPEMQDPPVRASSLDEAKAKAHEMLLRKLRDRGIAKPVLLALDWEDVPVHHFRP